MAQSLIRGSTQIMPGTITNALFAAGLALPTSQLANGANFIQNTGSVAMAASLLMGGFSIQNLGTPVNATDAATKSYVDSLVNGLTIHPFCRALASTNIATLSGVQTIDGVSLLAGNRVLLIGQTTGSQNGPWVVQSGAWTRPTDWASAAVLNEGAYFYLDPDGTAYKNTKWFCTNTGSITVDTTATTYSQDLSGSVYSTGAGLSLAGTVFSVNLAATSGLNTSSGLAVTGNAASLISVGSLGVGIANSTTSGQLIVSNASNAPTWTTLSGDATISATGLVSVNNTAGSGYLKYTNTAGNETPGGLINGTNTAFTLAHTPQNSSLHLYLNGQVLEPGVGNDYTISGSAITMLFIPQTGDKLRAYYFF